MSAITLNPKKTNAKYSLSYVDAIFEYLHVCLNRSANRRQRREGRVEEGVWGGMTDTKEL